MTGDAHVNEIEKAWPKRRMLTQPKMCVLIWITKTRQKRRVNSDHKNMNEKYVNKSQTKN